MLDINIPFTCEVTKEYCSGDIKNLFFQAEEKILFTIPISNKVLDSLNNKSINKIKKNIIKELKECIKTKQ